MSALKNTVAQLTVAKKITVAKLQITLAKFPNTVAKFQILL